MNILRSNNSEWIVLSLRLREEGLELRVVLVVFRVSLEELVARALEGTIELRPDLGLSIPCCI